ncbi:MAG: glucosidase [Nitrospirota bacterium]
MSTDNKTAEDQRLLENTTRKVFWKNWGPYLSERQWGTVREDYSENGDAWNYFPHDHARSRAYRWGEDGLAGISDVRQDLCFAPALWNGRDRFLKERLFGLNSVEGNHGEDVKELYYYLDNTPTHSYMKYLYKYPQAAFPYEQLVEENAKRDRHDREFELIDTGIFEGDRYFDVFVEYAKAGPEDILVRMEIINRGGESADITVLPTIWFRNTWAFGGIKTRPDIRLSGRMNGNMIEAVHEKTGTCYLYFDRPDLVLFTENETNTERLFNTPNSSPFVKDAFHDAVVHDKFDLFRDKHNGTKCGILYRLEIPAGKSKIIKLRLSDRELKDAPLDGEFTETFRRRISEADEFYDQFKPDDPVSDVVQVQRQAYAGLLWSKQYYNYELETWINGDKGQPTPPQSRKFGRNRDWPYLFNRDIISMPDKWEYPWYASWDLAFHCVPLSRIDPDFAKKQLVLFLREWYMHPNGQLPAYEWNFSDVNPPVHAWAALRVYNLEKRFSGRGDIAFLKRVFHKLLLNFTWWVNRKDSEGHNIFQGGFLGLDNIGAFDRSSALPTGGHIEQADGTSWMAMYSLNLMDMALEIAQQDPSYEDTASKFFEHFVHIAESLNVFGENGLWHEGDGFYYDSIHLPGGGKTPLRVRSIVGLTSLFAVSVISRETLERLPGFNKRLLWFRNNRINLNKYLAIEELREGQDILLSLVPNKRLVRILRRLLDENEFLSPGGIRSISRHHKDHPFTMKVNGNEYSVGYEPAESVSGLYGGNSNWRGPVWVPINYLFIDALKKYHTYYGDTLKVECPSGSGNFMDLGDVAKKLSQKITSIFIRDREGKRPAHGDDERYRRDPHFKDLVLFHEYFHADTCRGLGASHQTGWTGLVAEMIEWCWCR